MLLRNEPKFIWKTRDGGFGHREEFGVFGNSEFVFAKSSVVGDSHRNRGSKVGGCAYFGCTLTGQCVVDIYCPFVWANPARLDFEVL
jgi:hypothetical protein